MKRVAFDWGGVLSDSEVLRNFARSLLESGWEVHIIGVVFDYDVVNRDKAIGGLGIPFTGIHHLIDDGTFDHGEKKVGKMRELGCDILIDNSLGVVEKLLDNGMVGLFFKEKK